MLCTVTVDVNVTDEAIAFLSCISQLSYIDIKSIVVKEKSVERKEDKE